MRVVRLAAGVLEPALEPRTSARSRSRRIRPDRAPLAGRVRLSLALAALPLAVGAAVSALPTPRLAASVEPVRAVVASTTARVARFALPAPRRRAVVNTVVGIGACCIPLAVFVTRRRRRAQALEQLARLQQSRVPQVFEAALATTLPLRRSRTAEVDGAAADEGLPPLGPPSPEVAARAAALRASSVREAAARAVVLRAASERSESRRRAAALRARSRRANREEEASGSTSEAATQEARATSIPAGAQPAEREGSAVASSRRAMVELALEVPATLRIAASAGTVAPPASAPTAVPARRSSETAPPAPTPSGTAPFAPAPTDAHDESAGAVPTRTGASRVALLGASGPLTLEWLECCLARDPQDVQARLDLCTALLVAERFADAERVAREGLARDDGDGRLLLRLSEALAGLGRTEDALATALRAVRRHRSRKAVFHLTRIAALAHRFTPGDGPRLRKGLESRPGDPVFLHALGVFESLHGSPREGLRLLKLALHQERTPRWRRVVSREIARLRAEELAVANGPERLRARA